MSRINENESDQVEKIASGETSTAGAENEGWGAGLSALLTLPPAVPFVQYGERRSGRDRRKTDRRLTAREFTSS